MKKLTFYADIDESFIAESLTNAEIRVLVEILKKCKECNGIYFNTNVAVNDIMTNTKFCKSTVYKSFTQIVKLNILTKGMRGVYYLNSKLVTLDD